VVTADSRPSTTKPAFDSEQTAAILNAPSNPVGSVPEHQETTTARCRACHYGHHNECEDDRCACK
jgi:hypothetical protein